MLFLFLTMKGSRPKHNLLVEVKGCIPIGAGLGSSAAFATAVSAALLAAARVSACLTKPCVVCHTGTIYVFLVTDLSRGQSVPAAMRTHK